MRLRWSHSVVYVKNLPEMLDFYQSVLGFEVSDRGSLGPPGGPEIVFMTQVPDDHHQLAFLPLRRGDDPPNTVNHFAFRTGSLSDVRAMAESLEKDGRATDINPVTHGNAWSVYFKDPEGNGLEVFCDTPWHVAQPQAKPWDRSLSDDELFEWTKKEFENEPEFGSMEAYKADRKRKLGAG